MGSFRCVAMAVAVLALLVGAGYWAATPEALNVDNKGVALISREIKMAPAIRFLLELPLSVGQSLISLDLNKIKEGATKLCGGLHDFGDVDFELLSKILNGCEKECHMIGRIASRDWATNLLAVRARMTQILKEHPEVQDEVISQPIVIAGYARSSSTFLLHVLATTYGDSLRYPTFWESIGGLEADPNRPGSAIAEGQRAMSQLKLFPALSAMHEVDNIWQPEEDIGWMMYSLHGWYNLFNFHFSWLQFQSFEPGPARIRYAFLKRFLQIKAWQDRQDGRPDTRWVLKSPEHLHAIQELIETFPDARLVTLHRDEVPAYKSLLLLFHTTRGLTSPPSSDALLHLAADLSQCRQQAGLRAAVGLGANKTLALTFDDVTSHTMDTVARIAQFAGLPWDDTVRTRAEKAIQASQSKKKQMGKVRYTVEDFGLTDADIKQRIARCDQVPKDYQAWLSQNS